MTPFQPPTGLSHRIERVTGQRPAAYFTFSGGGYTPALRLIVHFDDGASAFVKAATSDMTAACLRTERTMYEHLDGSSFLPGYLGFDDGEEIDQPILILEDLSAAVWPPPWTTARIDAVLTSLADIHASESRAPAGLPRLEDSFADFASWRLVAATPEPFLSLGLCSSAWLAAALPALIAAENAAPLAGSDLLHLDVRSDNLCFRPNASESTQRRISAVLIDWNCACRGNRVVDIAGWLPSLQIEGGPPPETILPGHPECAALLSGYFAYRAPQPGPEGAPRVRHIQRAQLTAALPWAARTLGLPPPAGGANA